jgi:hypothetical protein
VGNSTIGGVPVLREIRWLGQRWNLPDSFEGQVLCGEGHPIPPLVEVIEEIGFKGFANLETSSPSATVEADRRRNLAFVRRLMA